MAGNPTLRKIGLGIGIAVGLFVLLIVGGWAMVIGIGALLGYAYTRTGNRGLLIAAAVLVGLGIGLALELFLAREGGVGVGLLGLVAVEWFRNKKLLWWAVIAGIAALGVSAVLWSSPRDDLGLYLTIFPFVILALLVAAGIEFWWGRKTQTA
jgi:hypothetical protein